MLLVIIYCNAPMCPIQLFLMVDNFTFPGDSCFPEQVEHERYQITARCVYVHAFYWAIFCG